MRFAAVANISQCAKTVITEHKKNIIMQENWLALAHVFSTKSPSVLATMINTEGATYQKMGTMILVDHQGHCSGLLSGGCLEADIAIHAKEVLRTGLTNILSYDLSSDADLLWGLGLGCEGKIDILLQPLTSDRKSVV